MRMAWLFIACAHQGYGRNKECSLNNARLAPGLLEPLRWKHGHDGQHGVEADGYPMNLLELTQHDLLLEWCVCLRAGVGLLGFITVSRSVCHLRGYSELVVVCGRYRLMASPPGCCHSALCICGQDTAHAVLRRALQRASSCLH